MITILYKARGAIFTEDGAVSTRGVERMRSQIGADVEGAVADRCGCRLIWLGGGTCQVRSAEMKNALLPGFGILWLEGMAGTKAASSILDGIRERSGFWSCCALRGSGF